MARSPIQTAGRLLVLALGAALAGPAAAQQREAGEREPLTETEKVRHLLSRFAFGPTPELVAEVRAKGMDAWFEEQLAGKPAPAPALEAALAELRSLPMDVDELLSTYRTSLPANPTREQRAENERLRNTPRLQTRDAVLLRAVLAPHQIQETASDFWRNHFNVQSTKDNVRFFVPHWEREVIRAHALGAFGAMLEASARHPAMLIYLDNHVSRRPASRAELREIAQRTRRQTGSRERAEESVEIARQRGLNENYARELLELHTLGVDNFYTQRDVVEVAHALTGWTVRMDPEAGAGFLFRPDMHSEGDRTFLGGKVRSDRRNPMSTGEAILRVLQRHPGTARFLAWKLCLHFVHDDPPEDMVQRVAQEFRRGVGDLPRVYRALYRDRDFFHPRNFQAKFKRPFEFVVSALRVTGAEVASSGALHRFLAELQEPIYECEDPTGYLDQAEAWQDPGTMAVRWRFAMDLAMGRIAGVRVPDGFYDGLHPRIPQVWADQLAERVLPAGMSARTRERVRRRVEEHLSRSPNPRPETLGPQILGLLLGSPEFQRQ